MPRHTESIEQRLFVRAWHLNPRLSSLPACAIPNGGKRGKTEASILKAEGVSPGAPDWVCFAPTACGHHGLALEFKRPDGTGRVSTQQRWWHNALRTFGWRVEIVTDGVAAYRIAEQCYDTTNPIIAEHLPLKL